MSTSQTEICGNYGISDSLSWQSHFLHAEIEPKETCEKMIEDCGCEQFSERVLQVGERYVTIFHGPDTPQQ